MRDSSRAERPFSFAADSQDVSVGEKGVHPHPSKTTCYEETYLCLRNQQVNIFISFHAYYRRLGGQTTFQCQ